MERSIHISIHMCDIYTGWWFIRSWSWSEQMETIFVAAPSSSFFFFHPFFWLEKPSPPPFLTPASAVRCRRYQYILLMEISSFLMSSAGQGRKYQPLRWWGRWTSRSCGRWGRWWGRSPWSTCQYRSPASPRSSPEGPVVVLVEMEVVGERFLSDIHCSLSSKKASWRKVTDGNGICWLLNFIKRYWNVALFS